MVARGNGRRFAPKKKIESFAIFIQLKKKEMISFFFDRILVALGSIFVLIGKTILETKKKKLVNGKEKKSFFFYRFFFALKVRRRCGKKKKGTRRIKKKIDRIFFSHRKPQK